MTAVRDIALLVPVKDLRQAKSRLSPLLSLAERRELAWRMLEGVLVQLAGADPALRRVMVTSYVPAMELARRLGFAVLEERQQVSESASVDAASAELAGNGVRGVLRVPLDLPLLATEHLQPLLAAAQAGAAAVLVPSRDRTGTNALYRAPPTLFASRFGPDSLALHEHAARAAAPAGHDTVRVLDVEGFALDVDDPDDVAALVRTGTPCPALDYLRALDVAARLARMAREPA